MYQYDLFIGHIEKDTAEAEKVKELAEARGLKVFLAKGSLKPSMRWMRKLKTAITNSRDVCFIVTSESLRAAWTNMEIGAAWALGKPITAIMKTATTADLPPQLSENQVANFFKADRYLDELLKKKNQNVSEELEMATYNGYRSNQYVQETLFVDRIGHSPFVFNDLLKVTQNKIFIAGQNLFTLLVKYGPENKKNLFKFLSKRKNRQAQILVCDPEYDPFVESWKEVTRPVYIEHLNTVISVLKDWVEEADKKNLKFEARKAKVVPVSITFVDPENINGKLAIVPNVFESEAVARPCFYLSRFLHKESFLSYWDSYNTAFLSSQRIYKSGTNLISDNPKRSFEQEEISDLGNLSDQFDSKLRDKIDRYFNLGEIRDLCLDLKLDYEALGGANKRERIIELILYFKRRNRLDELVEYCKTPRPTVKWGSV